MHQTATTTPPDEQIILHAIRHLEGLGYDVRRPAHGQLKVGPYNYWPIQGSITADHVSRSQAFRWKGLTGFVHVLQTAKRPLPRRTCPAQETPSMAAPPATAPAPPVRLDTGDQLPARLQRFDLCVEEAPAPMRAYLLTLIEAGAIATLRKAGATYVALDDFATASADCSDPPF